MKAHKLLWLILIPLGAFGNTYKCDLGSNKKNDKIEINIKKKSIKISLTEHNKKYIYKNCKKEKDDVGLLLDCTAGNLDLMILLSPELKPISGSIISSTHNLYEDINC